MNPLLYSLPLQAAPEVIDRIPSGYSNFVIPFVVGISFMLIWLTVGLIRLLAKIPADDRRRFWKSLITPKIALKNIKDLFCDCLFHTKIWKRKPLLGYMHSSIAFGWFMLIVLGHIEVALFVPKHLAWTDGGLFYPIFYRFFVWINPGHVTLRGWFFFFLMDFFPALRSHRSRNGHIQKVQIHRVGNAPHHEAVAGRPCGSLRPLDDFFR